MTTLARVTSGQTRRPALPPASFDSSAFISWIMSQSKRTWSIFDRQPDPSEAFMEYLEGYASTMDMYSVCSRPTGGYATVDSVVDEFWKVFADYAAAAGDLRDPASRGADERGRSNAEGGGAKGK